VRPGFQLALLIALLMFWPEWSTTEALAAVSCAAAVAFGASLYLFRGALPATRSKQLRQWGHELRKFTAAAWLNMLNLQLGLIVVGYISVEAAAEYRTGSQLAGLLALGLAAMNTHYAPAMSTAYSKGNMQELQRLATTTARVALALSTPLALILVLMGGPVLSLLYGPAYANAALPLAVLVIGQVINASTGPVGQLLMSTRNERPVLWTLLGAVVVNVVLSLLLIPAHGATGAAIATAASMAFWNTCLVVLVYSRLRIVSAPWGKRA
jgi:O-antigen/teichoic acid export membrane protein